VVEWGIELNGRDIVGFFDEEEDISTEYKYIEIEFLQSPGWDEDIPDTRE